MNSSNNWCIVILSQWGIKWYAPQHDKTNKIAVRPAKTQISLAICPVWSESSVCVLRVAKDPVILYEDIEDSDMHGRMPRLIWDFAGHTCHFVCFVMLWFSYVNVISKVRRLILSHTALLIMESESCFFELRHDKTNNVAVRPAKTHISLGIRPVWSESSLSAWRKLGSFAGRTLSLLFCHVVALLSPGY